MQIMNFAATAAKTSERGVIGVPTRKLTVAIIAATLPDLMLAALTERLTVEINSKTGEKEQLLTNVNLSDLAFYSQQGEGAIHVYKQADGKFRGDFTVTLTPKSGIFLTSENNLELTLAGCRPNFTYIVEARPEAVPGDVAFKYDQRVINQGTNVHNLPVTNIPCVVLPNTVSLERIDIHYVNGTTSTLTKSEIIAENNDTNDVVMLVDKEPAAGVICTQIITANNAGFLFLNLIDAHRVTLYTNGDVYKLTSLQPVKR